MQQRWFHRVLFTAKSVVTFDDVIFKGQVENISLNGALISFEKDITVNCGDKCFLTIYPEGENQPIRIIAEVVRFLRNMVGIKFVAIDAETQLCLYELVKRVTTEPDKMDADRERLKRYFVNYFAGTEPKKIDSTVSNY
jgi:PilZ domain